MADELSNLPSFEITEHEVVPAREVDEYKQYAERPVERFVCFDLLLQFIERCIEDGKDPTVWRNAAIYISCGCSVNGKSNAPTATGGRSMPSVRDFNPWSL